MKSLIDSQIGYSTTIILILSVFLILSLIIGGALSFINRRNYVVSPKPSPVNKILEPPVTTASANPINAFEPEEPATKGLYSPWPTIQTSANTQGMSYIEVKQSLEKCSLIQIFSGHKKKGLVTLKDGSRWSVIDILSDKEISNLVTQNPARCNFRIDLPIE